MAYLDWKIEGKKIDLCNCNYGCPCQFYAPPTYERCEGISFLEIEKGHFGDVPLDGLRLAMIAAWPGSIHEGEGIGQVVIDEGADDAQREALYKIVSGEEQEPETAFSIYASTMRDRGRGHADQELRHRRSTSVAGIPASRIRVQRSRVGQRHLHSDRGPDTRLQGKVGHFC